MIESLQNLAAADQPDAALLLLGCDLEAAMQAEETLPASASSELASASERVWRAIRAISALEAQTDSGLLVKAKAVARAYAELAAFEDDDAGADQRALASLVRDVLAGRKMAA
ncbi:hypothetical protein AMST5_04092 [freshwater sediment metagenome]|uniref:Uncharacterized protein n=1 Tax=freshwater sediment metagenome TaxID=556182 RepID=A0AA48M388_9ZZZZ